VPPEHSCRLSARTASRFNQRLGSLLASIGTMKRSLKVLSSCQRPWASALSATQLERLLHALAAVTQAQVFGPHPLSATEISRWPTAGTPPKASVSGRWRVDKVRSIPRVASSGLLRSLELLAAKARYRRFPAGCELNARGLRSRRLACLGLLMKYPWPRAHPRSASRLRVAPSSMPSATIRRPTTSPRTGSSRTTSQ